ncbi:MAG TPA: trypsin-like peptidase domain-containing protein [Thermoanaerobaculia bacterium]|nr:trypsin-like peptidase domain-containing protein [Thermoanaerobaculia bacterium]
MKVVHLTLAALAFSLPSAAAGQKVGPLTSATAAILPAKVSPPPRLAERLGAAPLAVLPSAAEAVPAEIQALQAWNEAGRLPVRNGFVRRLAEPLRVDLDKTVWGGEVQVVGAYRLRLHLAGVRLPTGTRLWVYSDSEVAGPFGPDLVGPDGGLWTPSVAGETARIDVELPDGVTGGGLGFNLDSVLEIVPVFEMADLPCQVDASCIGRDQLGVIDILRHAVARLQYIDNGQGFLCTGGLLNDTDPTTEIPYLLTAHHCISTPAEAASLEAFWDYFTESCGGTAPRLSQVPRSQGSTLLATGESSDFTLLWLPRVPPGRTFLGWRAAPVPAETLAYRLSHAGGGPQSYSVTQIEDFLGTCRDRPRPRFLYSAPVQGATAGGSSGAPVVLASGEVAGQLLGGCGSSDNCSINQSAVDGAFAATYPSVRQFLDPPRPCASNPQALCLLDGRFRVEVAWQNQYDGESGVGRAVPATDSTGFFYFYDASNYELIVKVLDFGDVIKVFYGQLTDLGFTLTVTDTRSGAVKRYQNGPNNCGGIDQTAFPSSAAVREGKKASCVADADTLCLHDRRYRVEVEWRNQFNGESGRGRPVALSRESGRFSFGDPTNIELVVKALDFGDRLLFFWGALSDLEYAITLTDTETGAAETYRNAGGNFCGGIDNDAF